MKSALVALYDIADTVSIFDKKVQRDDGHPSTICETLNSKHTLLFFFDKII